MNSRREAGKFQSAGSNHHHPSMYPQQPPPQPPPQQTKTVFVEKELPRKKKKFTRE
jgi:hypothetical protein